MYMNKEHEGLILACLRWDNASEGIRAIKIESAVYKLIIKSMILKYT